MDVIFLLFFDQNAILTPIAELREEEVKPSSPKPKPVEEEKKPSSRIKNVPSETIAIPTNSHIVDSRLQEYIMIYNERSMEYITNECSSRGLNTIGVKSDLVTLLAKDDISKV